jgi:hypothetical protein
VQPDRTKKAPQKPAVRTPSGDATRQSLLSRARKLVNSADEDIAYQAKEIIRALKNDKITAKERKEQAESLRILEAREQESADPPAPAASARATKSRKNAEQDVERELEDEDLSAWEADAAHDATDAVEEARARNEGTEPDYSETDPASRAASDAVRTALGKRYGEPTIAALINKGLLRIHESGRAAQKAQRSDSARMRGSQGFFDGKVIHLIAGNMTAEHAPSVLAHEFLHKFLHGLQGTPRYKALMRQLANLERAAKGGEIGAWFRKASARVQIADSADADKRLNETAAYAVEEYTRAPKSLPQAIVKWVRNFIANVRTFLMARGIPIGRLTEADLAAMSIRLLYEDAGAVESGGRANAGPTQTNDDVQFSERAVLTDNDMNTAFTLLALHDDAFQQVTPKGKTLQRVVEEIDPGYKVTSFNPGRDADRGWVLTTPSGAEGYVYERGGKVWIDVSDLTPGKDSGSRIYGMVAGYAHNTKKTFIGDPDGLTATGFYRRLENMISSTLRYGKPTTSRRTTIKCTRKADTSTTTRNSMGWNWTGNRAIPRTISLFQFGDESEVEEFFELSDAVEFGV